MKLFRNIWFKLIALGIILLMVLAGLFTGCKTANPDGGQDNPLYGMRTNYVK